MRIFSYGGGVQSTAVLILAARGEIKYDHFIFANVGEDSEHPETLKYFNNVALNYAADHELDLIEVRKYLRGKVETVYKRVIGPYRSIPIPAYMKTGAPGRRTCTVDFKIRVIARWTKKNGATKDKPATIGLGISIDEFQRARTDSGIDYQVIEYPLIKMRLSRQDCMNIISSEGLPIPPRSSCFFCPFKSKSDWIRMKNQYPELFEKTVNMEKRINEKREELNKDHVYLHQSLIPLDRAVGNQLMLWEKSEICESGYCFV